MEIWILVAAVLVPVLVTIFGDDLRKLRRVITAAFDFVRDKRRRVDRWYARCEERDFVAELVNDPEEATPVFVESLIDSDKVAFSSTQIMSGNVFRWGVIWKYRGFSPVLGSHIDHSGWTWAVVHCPEFDSVSGRRGSRELHWTESVHIDAATTYVDELIDESGVADYVPPRWFRLLRWLRIRP